MWLPKEKLLYGLTIGFFASLFLPPEMPVVNNIFIAGICILCFFLKKGRLLRHRPAILFMLLFFILQAISAAVSANHARAWSILAMRSPLLLFPLAFGGIFIRRPLKSRILLAYAVIVLIVSLCCLIDASHRSWVRQDTQWLYDDSLTIAIGRTAVYMALIVAVAIFCWVWLLENGRIRGKARWIAWAGTIFLVLFHFLLASRISLFYLYAVAIGYGCRRIARGARTRRVALLLGGCVLLGLVLLFFFPKTLDRMRQLEYLHFDYHSRGMESHYNMPVDSSQWNGANFRLAVWNCGWNIARHHLATGVPLGDKQAAFMVEYKARDFMFAYTRHRNVHNTWLDVLVNTGIAGCVIFLLGYLVLPLWTAVRTGDWLAGLIVGAFATALSTETWIDGSFGTVLLAFWLSMVSAWQRPAAAPKARLSHARALDHYP